MHHRFKYIYIFIFGALLCAGASGCFKDEGNYNYNEVNRISIDTFGVKSGFYQDSFFLTPRITATMDTTMLNDTSRYSYTWSAAIKVRDPLKDVPLVTLSTKKDLRVKLTIRPSVYVLYFKVTDRVTGNVYYQQTDLTVSTSTYEGWMVLCDVNNNTRVDMISFLQAPSTDTMLLKDVLNGSAMPALHGPKNIAYTTGNLGAFIYITAADGGHKVDGDFFYWQNSYNLKYDCLFDYGASFTPGYVRMAGSGSTYFLYYGHDYYYQFTTTSLGYGIPVNKVAGENDFFDASPYVGKAIGRSDPALLFDRTQKRLVRLNDNATTCVEIPDQGLFSYKTNMDLLYMVTNQVNQYTYAVLKDPATNNVFVYSCQITTNLAAQNFAKQITGIDIANAEFFAVSPEFGYMFYNVGSKVYEVDFDNPTTSKLVMDLGSKKITLLKFHQFLGFNATKNANKLKALMVGSYDPALPAESCGTLSQYSVPGLFGDPVLLKSWSGFGKIVSLTYRER
jgi:hypothetical protein